MKGVQGEIRKIWRYSSETGAQVFDQPGRNRAARGDRAVIQRGASWRYQVSYFDESEQLVDLSSGWTGQWLLRYAPSSATALLDVSITLDGAGNANPPNIVVELSAAQTGVLPVTQAWQTVTITHETGLVVRVLEGTIHVVA